VGEGRRVVLWTPSARDSLDEILAFIAIDSPAAAAKIAEVVLAAAESLSVFAERGRVVPETDTSAIREIFVYRYRLMYQVFAAEVRILSVLHGAMDFEGWLRRER
jgi:toxin ParE1/3/4